MASPEKVAQLKKFLDFIAGVGSNADKWIAQIKPLITDQDKFFIDVEPPIKELYELCSALQKHGVEHLSDTACEHICKVALPIQKMLRHIPKPSDPMKSKWLEQLEQKIREFYSVASGYVQHLRISDNVREQVKEIKKIENTIQEIKGETGAEHFSGQFLEEAEKLQKTANKWLWATALFAFCSIGTATCFLLAELNVVQGIFPELKIDSPKEVVLYISSKITFLFLLISATFWYGKLYMSTKHQVAAHSFKGNALRTFRTFVEATDDAEVKNMVLLETTRAIFSESATGYLKGEGQKIDSVKLLNAVSNGARNLPTHTT